VPVVLAKSDLSAQWSGGPKGPYRPGTSADFVLTLKNAGPDSAWSPYLTITADAPFENVPFDNTGYWSCEGDYSTVNFKINCSYGLDMAAGGTTPPNVFILHVKAPAHDKGGLNLAAAINSAYVNDPKPNNNRDSRNVGIAGPPTK
jgi:uncharacterized protein